jgi:hypothetical protein
VTGEIRAEPEALVGLAGQTLSAADGISGALAAAQGTASPPASAYGNARVSASVHAAVEGALADAEMAVGRLAGVYEGDVDRLYRVAFAYRQADSEAAERQRRAGRTPI